MSAKVHLVKAMVFPLVMYGCESWTIKKAKHRRVLERTLESPLDCKEIQPIHPEGNQSWIFTGRTDAEAETPILWPPDEKNWLIWKDPNAGKDWRQEEERTTEDDGWMASLTQWTWVWVNSRSWRWTGRPGVLQSMGSKRIGHDWATELNWPYLSHYFRRLVGFESFAITPQRYLPCRYSWMLGVVEF